MMPVDYSGAAVDERLRHASKLSAEINSGTPRVQMTREAIDLRLRQASDLSASCRSLSQLKPRSQ